MDLSTQDEYMLSEKSMRQSFDLSTDGNKLAYISTVADGCEIYVKDLKMGKEGRMELIYNFSSLSSMNCLDWNDEGNKILFSYYIKTDNGQGKRHNCILELK